jgi:hypothetical protein
MFLKFFIFEILLILRLDCHSNFLQIGKKATSKSERIKNVLKNPHLVDWFFGFRLNKFLEVMFDKILPCEWRWLRYEWQARNSIHAHGCLRLKNDPGLVELTAAAYKGCLKKIQFPLNNNNIERYDSYLDIMRTGVEAEERLTTYIDTLVSAMNPREAVEEDQCVPEPHPCCLDIMLIPPNEYSEDFNNLLNCMQRHVCRKEGYCKKKINKKSEKKSNKNPEEEFQCRFGFPFDLKEKTELIFTESYSNVRVDVQLKRNDVNMNPHIPIVAHAWRGNTDAQPITDYRMAIEYMVKYASKGNIHLYNLV